VHTQPYGQGIEAAGTKPTPTHFTKFPLSWRGRSGAVRMPSEYVAWEVELGGCHGRRVLTGEEADAAHDRRSQGTARTSPRAMGREGPGAIARVQASESLSGCGPGPAPALVHPGQDPRYPRKRRPSDAESVNRRDAIAQTGPAPRVLLSVAELTPALRRVLTLCRGPSSQETPEAVWGCRRAVPPRLCGQGPAA